MKNNYIIIHGSFSSPFSNWIPYLKKEIEGKGLEAYTPDFPSGVGFQNYDNLKDVKSYCNDIICLYSNNDPYVKYEAEKEFADTIADKQFMIENGGHLNAESGYIEFEELLKFI